jgi:hypothetical protein
MQKLAVCNDEEGRLGGNLFLESFAGPQWILITWAKWNK